MKREYEKRTGYLISAENEMKKEENLSYIAFCININTTFESFSSISDDEKRFIYSEAANNSLIESERAKRAANRKLQFLYPSWQSDNVEQIALSLNRKNKKS